MYSKRNEYLNKKDMKTTTTTSKMTSARLLFLFAVVLFSSFTMTAQNGASTVASVPTTEMTTATVSQNVSANETMSFVSWFMGTKQTTNGNQATEQSSKKQMMTSGIAPNRLLIKAFLKKASNYTSTIA
jgi:hypothetical protein